MPHDFSKYQNQYFFNGRVLYTLLINIQNYYKFLQENQLINDFYRYFSLLYSSPLNDRQKIQHKPNSLIFLLN